MKKSTLDTFIKRYYLGGVINKVKWKYSSTFKTLHARASADNLSFITDVIMYEFDGFGPNDTVVCIGDTEKVKGLLSPFSDDISLSINQSGDRILGFSVSDKDCLSYCAAADPSIIDPMPKNLQYDSDYDVEIPITESFIEKFLKSHTALKEVGIVAAAMNNNNAFEFVLGYTTSNSNRIRITPTTDPVKNKLNTGLHFPIKNIIEVLKYNKDIPNGTISISNKGIMRLYFKNDIYACTYYQFANKKT